MSIDNVIPEYWAVRLAMDFADAMRLWGPGATAADYSAQLAADGDTIHLMKLFPEVTIRDYTRNTDIAAPELQDAGEMSITLNQQKYWNIYVDDLDRVQAQPDLMTPFRQEATKSIRTVIERYCYEAYQSAIRNQTQLVWGRPADRKDEIPNSGKARYEDWHSIFDNILLPEAADTTAEINTYLNETVTDAHIEALVEGLQFFTQWVLPRLKGRTYSDSTNPNSDQFIDWPMDMTYCRVSRVVKYLLGRYFMANKISEASRAAFWQSGGGASQFFGIDFQVDERMDVYKPTEATLAKAAIPIAFGVKDAFGWISQVDKVEPYRPEKRFGDALKGLYLYGISPVMPEKLIALVDVKP